MRFHTATLASLALLVPNILGTSAGQPEQPRSRLAPRQDPIYVIRGVPGGVQTRLEVRQMQADSQLWNLFLASVDRLMSSDQAQKLSYYQIAGIHGQPTIPWDGVQSTGDPFSGYCPHSSNIFLTWHRPYLLLIEQVIYENALALINGLPDGDAKNNWLGVAGRMRFPYWDWAANINGPILPDAVTRERVTVTYPNGDVRDINNPFFQYSFHPAPGGDLSPPFDVWARTVRDAANINDPSSPSNNAEAESNLQGAHQSVRQNVYNILTQFQSWNQFSNHGSEASQIGNLESIHDGIHTSFGNAHMLYLTTSAFDPIFWLHHTNVDRIGALYQRVFPQTWISPFAQSGATFFYNAGAVLDEFSDLRPFHSDDSGRFWTSTMAADIRALGYTYPELANNPSDDAVRGAINQLYAPTTQAVTRSRPASRRRNRNRVRPFARRDGGLNETRTYIANVEAPWTALDGSYVIRLFYGNITTEVGKSMQDKNYAGSLAVLSRPGMRNDGVIRGSVVLTHKINDNGEDLLDDLGLDTILDSLKSDLRVRVEKNGEEVPYGQVPGLKVQVYSATVQPRKSNTDFPKWVGGLEQHLDIKLEDCK